MCAAGSLQGLGSMDPDHNFAFIFGSNRSFGGKEIKGVDRSIEPSLDCISGVWCDERW